VFVRLTDGLGCRCIEELLRLVRAMIAKDNAPTGQQPATRERVTIATTTLDVPFAMKPHLPTFANGCVCRPWPEVTQLSVTPCHRDSPATTFWPAATIVLCMDFVGCQGRLWLLGQRSLTLELSGAHRRAAPRECLHACPAGACPLE
jgi:hypothetical protein